MAVIPVADHSERHVRLQAVEAVLDPNLSDIEVAALADRGPLVVGGLAQRVVNWLR